MEQRAGVSLQGEEPGSSARVSPLQAADSPREWMMEGKKVSEQPSSGEPTSFFPHLATTHAASGTEMPHESGSNDNEQWRRVRLERIQPTQVQSRLDRLERQLLTLSQMSLNPGQGIQSTSQSFVDSSLTRLAQKRLRFDIKDVHQSIDRWDHFFLLYGVTSDREKFFAVEQLLPPHIEQAYASDDRWEPSYE